MANVEGDLSSPSQVTPIVDFNLDHILAPSPKTAYFLLCFLADSALCLDALQFLDAVLDGGYYGIITRSYKWIFHSAVRLLISFFVKYEGCGR